MAPQAEARPFGARAFDQGQGPQGSAGVEIQKQSSRLVARATIAAVAPATTTEPTPTQNQGESNHVDSSPTFWSWIVTGVSTPALAVKLVEACWCPACCALTVWAPGITK